MILAPPSFAALLFAGRLREIEITRVALQSSLSLESHNHIQ